MRDVLTQSGANRNLRGLDGRLDGATGTKGGSCSTGTEEKCSTSVLPAHPGTKSVWGANQRCGFPLWVAELQLPTCPLRCTTQR